MHMKKLLNSVASVTTSIVIIFSNTLLVHAYNSDSFTARLTEPSRNSSSDEYKYYYSSDNVFQNMGYGIPNCTAYAWGRTYELLGEKPQLSTGNAGRWYTYNINQGLYAYGSQPRLGAIACWDNHDFVNGHVAVVEQIFDNSGYITTSESQWGELSFALYTFQCDSSDHMSRYRFLGYIYPDETSGKFYGDTFQISSISDNKYFTVSENKELVSADKSYTSVMQDFRFEPVSDNTYIIHSAVSSKIISRNDDSVFFTDDNMGDDSLWSLYDTGNGQYTLCAYNDPEKIIAADQYGSLQLQQYKNEPSQFLKITRVTGITELNSKKRANTLTIDSSKSKNQYYPGEILDLTNISLSIDGEKLDTIDLTKLSPIYDFDNTGMTEVTINYGGLSSSYQVYVAEPFFDDSSFSNVSSSAPETENDNNIISPEEQPNDNLNISLESEISAILLDCSYSQSETDFDKYDLNRDSQINASDLLNAASFNK